MKYTTAWESPSNIALVKYWGKKPEGIQLPANSSISFTLSQCKTTTHLSFDDSKDFSVRVFLDEKEEPSFIPKIEQFLDRIKDIFPFVLQGEFGINTSNTFPHSSGIASSASGMSALALCICDVALSKNLLRENDFFQMASTLSRLGSGSASRSIYGPMGVWGNHPNFSSSNDEYAVSHDELSAVFETYCDTILLVHKGQKSVSSTVGHDLVKNHPFSASRFKQAQHHMAEIKSVLKSGNLDEFIRIVEQEALTLHSLMMSSNPYFLLMKPNTLKIIEAIWEKRARDNVKWCFTLDAGANVHFLYPHKDKEVATLFIEQTLKPYCENGAFIHDHVGKGPNRLQ